MSFFKGKGYAKKEKLMPLPDAMYFYEALDKKFDFYKVVKWKTFNMKDERHVKLLEEQLDPVGLDDLQEVGLNGEDEIIQLPCATERYKCNYTKDSLIQTFLAKPECVVCNTNYPIPGPQPSGSMEYKFRGDLHCEGFKGAGVIVMFWIFPSGTQGPSNLQPGKPFKGGKKVAYLPDTIEGRRALMLILKAFQRGHLFTIAKSYTVRGGPRLTFSSIHLKSSTGGGSTVHGWPDDNYFMRLRSECAAKMIFDNATEKEMSKMHEGTSLNIL